MSKHTPGPWEIRRGYTGTETRIVGEYRRRTVGIAEIYREDEPGFPLPHEANARLIAAAPKMLMALTQAAEYLNPRTGIRSEAALGIIRDAIFEAVGQS